ncbi:MAG: acetate--CoA ligase [Candidatus Omnitrophica bacterium]|nr:acetate--CoA ligase [Candidatus Omnitrophota bacterium]
MKSSKNDLAQTVITQDAIDVLLKENRKFPPPADFQKNAWVKDESVYEKAAKDPEAYWAAWASELQWMKPWKKILDWKPPRAQWFVGGKINASVNCVDRHVFSDTGHHTKRNKAAIIWEGEPGDTRTLTYWDLYREVNQCANVLKKLGIKKGDRVGLYLPLIPELLIACLACARIGAVHSVVFGGFSSESLRDRMNDAEAKLVITADFGWRRGNQIQLKKAVDEALSQAPSVKNVIVVRRNGSDQKASPECSMQEGRDLSWHQLMQEAKAYCEPAETDAEDMLFILYTSGTTGKPKGIVHTTGGYLTGVYATTKWIFDLKEEDVFWCTADIGWITGHSYVIYGPLANGATVLMYEGAPDWPEKNRFWKLIEKYGVTIFYTAPTAIRAFMKWGNQWPAGCDLSSLRLLGSVGEPINPEAWMWYQEHIGRKKCPVVDTWWQTETGCILISPLPGVTVTKPGSATKPFPGISAEILNEAGECIKTGGGYVALTKPWPSMLRTIYNDDERYVKQYWSKWRKDIYFAGDGANRDEEGYFWFMGRVDDVMNVAGHRIGTMEVESALVDHPAVAEAAVVGKAHEIKGQALVAFVTLKAGNKSSDDLAKTLKEHVAKKIGAIARPEEILFSADLPKTRSGKIMRRLLRDIAEGKALGDTTTLADASVIESLKQQYESVEGS